MQESTVYNLSKGWLLMSFRSILSTQWRELNSVFRLLCSRRNKNIERFFNIFIGIWCTLSAYITDVSLNVKQLTLSVSMPLLSGKKSHPGGGGNKKNQNHKMQIQRLLWVCSGSFPYCNCKPIVIVYSCCRRVVGWAMRECHFSQSRVDRAQAHKSIHYSGNHSSNFFGKKYFAQYPSISPKIIPHVLPTK